MASLTFSNALLPLAGTDKVEAVEPAKTGFFARFFEALTESRRQSAERELKRLGLAYGLDVPAAGVPSLKVKPADLPFGE